MGPTVNKLWNSKVTRALGHSFLLSDERVNPIEKQAENSAIVPEAIQRFNCSNLVESKWILFKMFYPMIRSYHGLMWWYHHIKCDDRIISIWQCDHFILWKFAPLDILGASRRTYLLVWSCHIEDTSLIWWCYHIGIVIWSYQYN